MANIKKENKKTIKKKEEIKDSKKTKRRRGTLIL